METVSGSIKGIVIVLDNNVFKKGKISLIINQGVAQCPRIHAGTVSNIEPTDNIRLVQVLHWTCNNRRELRILV
jgi:hypothetical protein